MKLNDKMTVACDGHPYHAQTVEIMGLGDEKGVWVRPAEGEDFAIDEVYLVASQPNPVPVVLTKGDLVFVRLEGHEIDGETAEVTNVAELLATIKRSDVEYIVPLANLEKAKVGKEE